MLKENVIVIVSDENYLNHAKSLFMNLIYDCDWKGDLCLITDNKTYTKEFEDIGIFVKRFDLLDYSNDSNCMFQKLFVFDVFFKKWKKVLYLDCDIMFFENIDSSFNYDIKMSCDVEPWCIEGHPDCRGFDRRKNEFLFNELVEKYDIQNNKMYNAGSFMYDTSILSDNTVKELFELKNRYQELNTHANVDGSDQPIINIKFLKEIEQYKDNLISYFGTFSKTKGYHFCHWEAPWKNDRMSRFGITYRGKYNLNLRKWKEMIKK